MSSANLERTASMRKSASVAVVAPATSSLSLPQKHKEKKLNILGDAKVAHVPLPIRILESLLIWLIMVAAIVGGGFHFLYIEKNSDETTITPNTCIEEARKRSKEMNVTLDETLDEVQECLIRSSRIETVPQGILYAWSLFSTTGYGDRVPHTSEGRTFTVIYSSFFISLYMFLKTEVGEAVSWCLLCIVRKVIDLLDSIFQRFFSISVKDKLGKPKGCLLGVILLGILVIFCCTAAFPVMFLNDMSYSSALYLTLSTVSLIGLGDVIPKANWWNILIVLPHFLVGDALFSYWNYFSHGKWRMAVHWVVMKIINRKKIEEIDIEAQLETKYEEEEPESIVEFPSVTTNMMPIQSDMEDEEGEDKEMENDSTSTREEEENYVSRV